MIERIQHLLTEVSNWSAKDAAELEALRLKYLSKKGEISLLFNDFRNVPSELKKEVGQRLNELKTQAHEKLTDLKSSFEQQDSDTSDLDYSRSIQNEIGRAHV